MTGVRRSRAWSPTLVVVVALGLVLVPTAYFAWPGSSTRALLVATSGQVHPRPDAVFQRSGTVRAIRHGGLVCFATDPGGVRLVFPEGYTASPDLELLDPSGEVVATPGTAAGFAFSATRVEAPAGCGAGPVRAVVRIEGLRG